MQPLQQMTYYVVRILLYTPRYIDETRFATTKRQTTKQQ